MLGFHNEEAELQRAFRTPGAGSMPMLGTSGWQFVQCGTKRWAN
jgi:hypothetical protein